MSLVILTADQDSATLVGDSYYAGKSDPAHRKVFSGPGGTIVGFAGHAWRTTNFDMLTFAANELGFSPRMTWAEGGAILERWTDLLAPTMYGIRGGHDPIICGAILAGRLPNGHTWARIQLFVQWVREREVHTDTILPSKLALCATGQSPDVNAEMDRMRGWHRRPPTEGTAYTNYESQRPFFICDDPNPPCGAALAAHLQKLTIERNPLVAGPLQTVML